jgi:nucleoside-diphosphate-sugar epimerase
MSGRVALVAGATGLIGRRIAEHLARRGWEVVGLCRRPRTGAGVPLIAVDLTCPDDCRAKLAPLTRVTHVFYAARYDHPEGVPEDVNRNAAMLANLVDALEPAAPRLAHVHAVHGTKYYGHNLGPIPVPVREDSPRTAAPNFYFAQEDFLRARAGRWSWSTSRPHTFLDAAPDEPRNVALLIAVYAAVRRALGEPLAYPGTPASYAARTQFTELALLARAVEHISVTPRCANQSYNIVNGDSPRWADLWPGFARAFGLAAGPPEPLPLSDYMADKEPVWQALVARHGLRPTRLAELVRWPYAAYVFRPEWDIISATDKARRDGCMESMDSARAFAAIFDRLRDGRIVPKEARP